MKENQYDNEAFFDQYSRFPRSVDGLRAAGEWHVLQTMLPDFCGKRVLDVGCGFGWHCIYAAEHGAEKVVGVDLSEKMLAVARQKIAGKKSCLQRIEYHRMAMEEIDFAPGSFDVAISSLAFHYTPDFEGVCASIRDCLAEDGVFVFSVEHPTFTAHGTQDWAYDKEGKRDHWPVDRYFAEGRREAVFLGEPIVKYHKTLATYLNTLLGAGFSITGIAEPQPAAHLLDTVPGMRDELRRPMMLLVSAKKAGAPNCPGQAPLR